MLRCKEIEVRRRYRLLILYVDIVDHSIAVNIEKLTRVTAPAASCPLGPAHAGIKMRTHQHTIHCSQHPAGAESGDKPVSGHERSSSSSSMQLQLLCTLQLPSRGSLQPDTGRCCSCLGGAGRGHQGEGRTVTISSALRWPPAYTGHPPPRRPGFIGAVFSRAACNPRLGRAADCHTRGPRVTSWPRSRVTCHVSPSSPRPRTDCLAWLVCGRLGLRTLDTAGAQMSPAPSRTLM